MENDLLKKIVSLSKRRGFIFQSSEIYGGLKSAYDFGPLGVELKRNIAQEWWRTMVLEREDIVGLDASIMMDPTVWKASGHLAGFSDPLVDCYNCKERFRPDKVDPSEPGSEVTYVKGGKDKGEKLTDLVGDCGYVCPKCSSPELSDVRQFNLMFRTSIGPVDPLNSFLDDIQEKKLSKQELRAKLEEAIHGSAIYLRPETAQAIFVQFLNVQQTMSMKVPFGIAQQGKSFRNEITTERFVFRTCEFEQMEMEFFIEPNTADEWMDYWTAARMQWWTKFANNKDAFRLRPHEADELAHYATGCFDVEYRYPWGWDELEGIASRTNYDLTKHQEYSGTKMSYFDQNKTDPETGKSGWRYLPWVIEPAAGLTRGVLAFLLDAYAEETGTDASGNEKTRVLLKLNPRLAPYKAAILPLVRKDGLPDVGREIAREFFSEGLSVRYDEVQSIGKRYARHDEVGTPYCITVDHQTRDDETVTIRDRDTTDQERVPIKAAVEAVKRRVAEAL